MKPPDVSAERIQEQLEIMRKTSIRASLTGARIFATMVMQGGMEMTRIEKAIIFAVEAHADATRKGKNRPYILHPIEAMTIVASLTNDEDVIIAAILHDVVEDTAVTAKCIKHEFGERVMKLVQAESEDKMPGIPADVSWKQRKQATIDHLGTLCRDAKLICLGEKLANIREISRDYELLGDALWDRFNQKDKSMHDWYYSSVCSILEETFGNTPAVKEYRELLKKVFEK